MEQVTQRVFSAFSRLVAVLLLVGAAAVVLLAVAAFLGEVVQVARDTRGAVTYGTLQTLFDLLLGAVIALELANSVQLMASGQRGFAQVRSILVIGILAVVRKLIVLELDSVTGVLLMGLAAAVLALGLSFAALSWLDGTARRQGED
ncbi:phosphate-starvation-inducible PsiE family protein [Roseivivax isoporae]|uniref:Protein PsiE n=1 Tax=Roseivivax isoporae LMG 25204 TaxID=1449351 RepID=X7F6A5_9RHOB|nr:phosphate-starvation-inducible PsiE family protein [Roseivivax isoporae]ETX27611.1 hypothetical protein RISW2_13300 [Roseivivax isoporae LMG 25204]